MTDRVSPSLGYLSACVAQALADSLRRNFLARGLDLTHAQFVLLLDLFAENGLTQQQLAAKVFKDKAAIKRTVDLLVAKGLVRRGTGAGGRNVPVYLTAQAYALEPVLRSVGARTLDDAVRTLLPGELDACLAVLRKLQLHFALEQREDSNAS